MMSKTPPAASVTKEKKKKAGEVARGLVYVLSLNGEGGSENSDAPKSVGGKHPKNFIGAVKTKASRKGGTGE